ncbi:MAG: tRNA (cytidine(34)-2'-O)-methyltransferase [Phycisphaeraceae bacterium]|nr:tRNA (cytidine(34)-2'-O)-methyltransferase [Phycisphaeraceae bacterium]
MPGLFEIVLHEPEIPNNTGNIGRTCVALGCPLHLIHPLGFELSEKACRRAGLDYWPRLALVEHSSWSAYITQTSRSRRWLFSTGGSRSVYDADFRAGDHLVFGCETRGLPETVLEADRESVVSLPMVPGERSLNVATAVTAAVYVALQRLLAVGEVALDHCGRLAIDGQIKPQWSGNPDRGANISPHQSV